MLTLPQPCFFQVVLVARDRPWGRPSRPGFAVRVQRYMACLLQELRSGGAGAFQEDFQRSLANRRARWLGMEFWPP